MYGTAYTYITFLYISLGHTVTVLLRAGYCSYSASQSRQLYIQDKSEMDIGQVLKQHTATWGVTAIPIEPNKGGLRMRSQQSVMYLVES